MVPTPRDPTPREKTRSTTSRRHCLRSDPTDIVCLGSHTLAREPMAQHHQNCTVQNVRSQAIAPLERGSLLPLCPNGSSLPPERTQAWERGGKPPHSTGVRASGIFMVCASHG